MAAPHDPLSPSDALLWRIEADPVLRSPILVIGTLDRVPPWARVVSGIERAVAAIPRLRQRIVEGDGHPAWEDCEDFHVEHHLRRVRVDGDRELHDVLRVVELEAADGFEPTRPPWTFTLVEDLAGGGAAFALRFHHAISDGVGAVGLAEHLFDLNRRGSSPEPELGAGPPEATIQRPGSPILAVVGAVGAGIRAATDPLGTLRRSNRFGRSVLRMLSSANEPLSPLWRDRSLERRLHVLEVPLAELIAAAAAAGGTVNDLFLGSVGGAAQRYHEAAGSPVAALRFTVPINLRTEGDDAGGNRFSPARFILPVDDPDPVHRARLAGAVVRSWRAEPALGATSLLAAALDRLPTPVLVRLFAGMLRGVDIDAVDVPGIRRPAYFAGAKVHRLWAFAPPTGAALSITLVSHGDTACIGVASDLAAVADPDQLADCLREALEEGLALGRRTRTRATVRS